MCRLRWLPNCLLCCLGLTPTTLAEVQRNPFQPFLSAPCDPIVSGVATWTLHGVLIAPSIQVAYLRTKNRQIIAARVGEKVASTSWQVMDIAVDHIQLLTINPCPPRTWTLFLSHEVTDGNA